MKILQNWRIFVILFLVAWCAILLHPFSKQGTEITYAVYPSSALIRAGDVLYSINEKRITSIEEFESQIKNIEGDQDISVAIERETFPYNYIRLKHLYITNDDKNPVSFYAKPTSFSKIQFNANLQEANRFTIKTSDPENTINVLEKRFKIARVSDSIFEKQDGNVILYTTAGNEIVPVIEAKGDFEARIGNDVFFTQDGIKTYCISAVNCMIHTYPVLNQTQDSQEVLWRYGFETHLKKEAAESFSTLAKNLAITTCEYDRCELNESIMFYIDGEQSGFEKIYADDKNNDLSRLFIGGEEKTKNEAIHKLRFMQAALSGETDAKVTDIQRTEPLAGSRTIFIFIAVIAGLIILNAVLLLVQFRGIIVSLVSAAVGISEIIIILGILAGLNFTITLSTMAVITAVPLISLVYQNFAVRWIKKEGLIFRKVSMLNTKLNIWMWAAAGISLLIIMFSANIGTPLLIYFILTIIVTKGLFFRAVKAKKN